MKITIKDHGEFNFNADLSAKEILDHLLVSGRITKNEANRILIVKYNNELLDLTRKINYDGELEFITFENNEGKGAYWHTSSHVMAQAIKRLYADTKLAIGPSIENGFYYDLDMEHQLSESDLDRIEKEMHKIVKQNLKIERIVMTKKQALNFFKTRNEPYKVELINELDSDNITVYQQGEFYDLCRGPHLKSTGVVKFFKLLSIAGAYWRGDERNKMLQRIYGISFSTHDELNDYINRIAEAKKRDHRILGRNLDLFSIQEKAGKGLIYWHPNGAIIRMQIENLLIDEQIKRGYSYVYTPHIALEELWKISGHLDYYKENMYSPMNIEGQKFILKPMNCTGHILIFKSRMRSYRDLPVRYAENGSVYRYERSGTLQGLHRVRGFTQDDAHIFCRLEQIKDEIKGCLDLVRYINRIFRFDYEVYLSTRPPKYAGILENWNKAEDALRHALEEEKMHYSIDPGAGVFYGPKIDFKLIDTLNRRWQGTTIQVDFNLPERFDINFINEKGKEERVVMIHRAILGSYERFFGCIIEQFNGKFPLWLAPTQIIVIPISEKFLDYAREIHDRLKGFNPLLRIKLDERDDKLNAKIRDAQMMKIPFMVIVGKKEEESNSIALRDRDQGDLGTKTMEEFQALIVKRLEDYT